MSALLPLARFVRDELATVFRNVFFVEEDNFDFRSISKEVTAHAQMLIEYAKENNFFPQEYDDFEDLAEVFANGHLYCRDVALDVCEIIGAEYEC